MRRSPPARAAVLSALLIGASTLGGCSNAPPPPPVPDHVVLIVVDTLRADHLSAYGHGRETSPAIDRLAADGVLFERAVAQASWTSPSMVSLMTGRYVAGERLDPPSDIPVLAELLRDAGWATAAFVANPLISEKNGFDRGFERFERIEDYGSDEVIAAWIRSRANSRAFTYVHLNEPHDDKQPDNRVRYLPPEGDRHFRAAPRPLSPERVGYYERIARELSLEEVPEGIEFIAEETSGYDDDVRWADRRVEAILRALEESGQARSSAVVLAADHGEGLWTRVAFFTGQRAKRLREGEPPTLVNTLMPTHGNQVNAELVHVPLVLRAPGLPRGRRIAEPVENVDIVPTLLELCRLPRPEGLHGRSLLPLLSRGSEVRREAAFSHTRMASTLITRDGWQLILPTDLGRCEENLDVELYDLNADPEARRNLAAEHPGRVSELSEAIRARLKMGLEGAELEDAALGALGYVDAGIVPSVRAELSRMDTSELVHRATDPGSTCFTRIEALRALGERELDGAAREALAAHLANEHSQAVRGAIEALLAQRKK